MKNRSKVVTEDMKPHGLKVRRWWTKPPKITKKLGADTYFTYQGKRLKVCMSPPPSIEYVTELINRLTGYDLRSNQTIKKTEKSKKIVWWSQTNNRWVREFKFGFVTIYRKSLGKTKPVRYTLIQPKKGP